MIASRFLTSIAIAVLTAFADGALVRVDNFGTNPTNLQMNIYVPSKLATSPGIILAVRIPLLSTYTFYHPKHHAHQ